MLSRLKIKVFKEPRQFPWLQTISVYNNNFIRDIFLVIHFQSKLKILDAAEILGKLPFSMALDQSKHQKVILNHFKRFVQAQYVNLKFLCGNTCCTMFTWSLYSIGPFNNSFQVVTDDYTYGNSANVTIKMTKLRINYEQGEPQTIAKRHKPVNFHVKYKLRIQ